VREHPSLDRFTAEVVPRRLFALTTKAQRHYDEVEFADGDAVLFGPETRGLPSTLLSNLAADRYLRIPMVADSRSLNLSNAVAVVVYEAWRQRGFPNAC
jgi:tRNA (cytidine/uridine-2'-O-)-methyltransferase